MKIFLKFWIKIYKYVQKVQKCTESTKMYRKYEIVLNIVPLA